jgi:lysylphosphatidylglycerol synthetase-like protein (DUF2156 family)
LGVSQGAAALVALAGLSLLLLSRGVRLGQRRAWRLSLVLLVASSALHLLKGIELEEAAPLALLIAFLVRRRWAFTASADRPSLGRAFAMLGATGAIGVGMGTAMIELTPTRRPHPSVSRAIQAVAQRLLGVHTIAIPSRVGTFITPVLEAIGVGVIVAAGWILFRPVIVGEEERDLERARSLFRRHGGDTYSYFALRDDKDHFFWGDSVVAYAVLGGVCLVSPDPIGPPDERAAVWAAFRRFADERSWTVAVLAASADWLPVYWATGMKEFYLGDEGVVDLSRFTLEGGRFKGLRQAVNRIERNGYRVEFADAATIGPELRAELRRVMTQSRRGDAERGFSYTLGRVFDPHDTGLLLAIAYGPSGSAEAFCQYVPAPAINGYSLDLMRRTSGPHPNGLIDALVVRSIFHLREQGYEALGLNFAAMRAILAGELGDGLPRRMEKWLFQRMSDSVQMESLWRFNAKYDPDWHPRYWVYDSPETVPAAALAVVRAESVWELPVVGRLLKPPA